MTGAEAPAGMPQQPTMGRQVGNVPTIGKLGNVGNGTGSSGVLDVDFFGVGDAERVGVATELLVLLRPLAVLGAALAEACGVAGAFVVLAFGLAPALLDTAAGAAAPPPPTPPEDTGITAVGSGAATLG